MFLPALWERGCWPPRDYTGNNLHSVSWTIRDVIGGAVMGVFWVTEVDKKYR